MPSGNVHTPRRTKRPAIAGRRAVGSTLAESTSFEDIGLSPRAGWIASVILYGLGGLAVIVFDQLSAPGTINAEVKVVALIAIGSVPFLLLGAFVWSHLEWLAHVRIALGLTLLTVGGFVAGTIIGAMWSLVLLPLLAVAYLHKPKLAIPYVLYGSGAVFVIATLEKLPSSNSHAIVCAGLTMLVSASLLLSQYRVRKVAETFRSLSVTDPLTGIANLRRLHSRLTQEINRSSRSGSRIALFALDLDDFKQVNDHFSHAVGDRLLIAVSRAIEQELSAGDLVARRGGDEFAVLAISNADRDLDSLATRIRAAIREARLKVCPEVNPEGSVAYVIHKLGETAEDITHRADQALHEQKLLVHPERVAEEAALSAASRDASAEFRVPISTISQVDNSNTTIRSAPDLAVSTAARQQQSDRAQWLYVGFSAGGMAAVVSLVAASGWAPDLHNQLAFGGIVGLYLVLGTCVAAASRLTSEGYAQLAISLQVALLTIIVMAADRTVPALTDLFMLPVLVALYAFPPRRAAPIALAGLACYIGLLAQTDYPYTMTRLTMGSAVFGALSVMLIRASGSARGFLERIESLSVVDALTGMANLRGLQNRVSEEIDRCTTVGGEIALIEVDLDQFKKVNDLHSHTLGDTVLVATARAIQETVREDEMVARRGGDEFAIVCALDPARDVEALCKRIEEAIEQARSHLCPDLIATASVGYVTWRHGELANALMERADAVLHDAKVAAHARIAAESNAAS